MAAFILELHSPCGRSVKTVIRPEADFEKTGADVLWHVACFLASSGYMVDQYGYVIGSTGEK